MRPFAGAFPDLADTDAEVVELRRGHGQGPTKDQLYNEAKQRNIEGRSKMNKKQLANAPGR